MELMRCFWSLLLLCFALTVADGYSIAEVDNLSSSSLCQNYQGNACKTFIGNQKIYVKDSDDIQLKESIIQIATENITSGSISYGRCKNYTLEYLCRTAFPLCDVNSTHPLPRQVCRDECEVLEYKICARLFIKLKQDVSLRNHILLPVCEELPSIDLPESNGCMRIGIPDVAENNENTFFVGSYRGKKSHTISGERCQPWNLQRSYSKSILEFMGGHSYCRRVDYGSSLPMCFTVTNVRKEMCLIRLYSKDINESSTIIRHIQIMKITKSSVKFDISVTDSVKSIEVRGMNAGIKTFKPGDVYEIGGLNPGYEYNFYFTPIGNKRLPWDQHDPSKLTISGIALLPDKPEIIFQNLEDNKVKVRWIHKGNAVDQYELKYYMIRLDGSSNWTPSTFAVTIDLPSEAGSNYTIADLSSKTYYELQLRAHTIAGFGEASKHKFYID